MEVLKQSLTLQHEGCMENMSFYIYNCSYTYTCIILYYIVLYFIVLQYMQANLSVAALEGVTHAGNIDLDAVVIIGQLRCWVVWTSVLVALATLN